MHIHALRFQAIGPFPGRHLIDMQQLAASGLFLLEGPTGSGKSTIIDAIVFALYGDVAAVTASTKDRLRSDHADPGTESFVDLVFETAAGVFRIRRTPQFLRPKKRGTGTTVQNMTVRLWRVPDVDACLTGDGSGPAGAADAEFGSAHDVALSTRIDEAGDEIQRIVGLTRSQFVQTVVLPQGEFAAFLRSDSEERRAVLQRLFGTDIYERMQEALEERRRQIQRERDRSRERVVAAVSGVLAVSSTDDLPPEHAEQLSRAADELDGAFLTEQLAALETATRRAAATTRAAAAAATVRAEAAAHGQRSAQSLVEQLDHRARLRTERADLAGSHDRIEVLDRRLALDDICRDLIAAADEYDGAARRWSAAWPTVSAEPAPTVDADGAVAAVARLSAAEPGDRARCDELTERAGALDAVAALEERLPALTAEADQQRDLLVNSRARLEAAAEELAQRPEQRAALAARRQGVATRAERFVEADRSHGRALLVRDALTRTAQARARIASLESEASHAHAEAAAATDWVHELHRRQLAHAAATLAQELIADEPCPVCGSCEHPSPTHADAEAVTDDQLAAAEEDRRRGGECVKAAAERLAAARAEHEESLRQIREHDPALADLAATDPAAADTQAKQAVDAGAAALDDAERARAELTDLNERLDAFDRDSERFTATHAELSAQVAAAAERSDAAQRRLAEAAEQIREAVGSHASVREHQEALRAERAEVERTLTAGASLRSAHEDAVSAARAISAGITAAGALGEDLLAATMTDTTERIRAAVCSNRSELKAQLDAHHARAAAIDRELADTETALVALDPVDLWPAAEECDLERLADQFDEPLVRAIGAQLSSSEVPVREAAVEADRELLAVGGRGSLSDELTLLDLLDEDEQQPAADDEPLPRWAAAELSEADAQAIVRTVADRHAEARTRADEAVEAAAVADNRAEQVTTQVEEVRAALARCANDEADAAPVLRLARLVSGASGQGGGSGTPMTLATYVLVRRFEDVVAAANDRLRAMSDGRYELQRIDDRESGSRSRRAGLGLRVTDHLTQRDRDPKTLSGGETFYVSLCLALGLADVVVAEAGGIDLGMLFVDEGFGSLDPDTLDAVLTELGKLRAGGREVGIVSHVEELKQRIPERIEVRRRPGGASTLAVRA